MLKFITFGMIVILLFVSGCSSVDSYSEPIHTDEESDEPTITYTSITQRIHEDMPEFTFYIIDEAITMGDRPYRTSIRIENNGETVQIIEDLYRSLLEELTFVDFNSDGYLDLALVSDRGGTRGNRPTFIFLWDTQSEQFVMNETLIGFSISGSVMAREDGRVVVSQRGSMNSMSFDCLEYIENDFVHITSEYHYLHLEDNVWEITITNALTGEVTIEESEEFTDGIVHPHCQ